MAVQHGRRAAQLLPALSLRLTVLFVARSKAERGHDSARGAEMMPLATLHRPALSCSSTASSGVSDSRPLGSGAPRSWGALKGYIPPRTPHLGSTWRSCPLHSKICYRSSAWDSPLPKTGSFPSIKYISLS